MEIFLILLAIFYAVYLYKKFTKNTRKQKTLEETHKSAAAAAVKCFSEIKMKDQLDLGAHCHLLINTTKSLFNSFGHSINQADAWNLVKQAASASGKYTEDQIIMAVMAFDDEMKKQDNSTSPKSPQQYAASRRIEILDSPLGQKRLQAIVNAQHIAQELANHWKENVKDNNLCWIEVEQTANGDTGQIVYYLENPERYESAHLYNQFTPSEDGFTLNELSTTPYGSPIRDMHRHTYKHI